MRPEILRAISRFVSKDDVRWYLNYILLESTERGTRLIGSDGRVMGMYTLGDKIEGICGLEDADYPDGRWLIDPSLLKPISYAKKALSLEFEAVDGSLVIKQGFDEVVIPQNEEEPASAYPDMNLTMDVENIKGENEAASYVPEQYYRFHLAARDLRVISYGVQLHPRGDRPAPVTISNHPNFMGLIAPYNDSTARNELNASLAVVNKFLTLQDK